MAQINIVKNSNLSKEYRLDSEYYKKEYVNLFDMLNSIRHLKNSELCIIKSGTTPRDRDDELKEGIILLKTNNIRNKPLIEEDKSGFYHIDSKTNEKMKSTKLKSGDVLINIVGATPEVIGRTAIIYSDFPESNITQAMALCRAKKENILPEYLFIYLQSSFGKMQIGRLSRPTGQFNLNLEELGSILVPTIAISNQKIIAELVKLSHEETKKSKQFYTSANNKFLGQIGITNKIKTSWEVSFVNLSEIKRNNRIDAEFYQPKYQKIIDLASENASMKKLGNLVKFSKGIEVGSEEYQEEGIPFVRVSNLSKFEINDNNQEYISKELFESLKNKFKPKKGEILLSKDATPGMAFLIEDEKDMIISGGILRLKVESDINKNYLTHVLNSLFVQSQIERDAGGSIIIHWRPELIKETLIPILPKAKQEEISKLIEESHKSRIRAKQLLEEAKKKVEELIEKQAK